MQRPVEVRIDNVTTQTVYIEPVNNLGNPGTKVKMIETAPGSGLYMPQSLVNYSWNQSFLFVPTYMLRIYADDTIIGTLTATVRTVPTFAEFTKLIRSGPEEIQNGITGSHPNYALISSGTTNLYSVGLQRPVEVKINGVSGHTIYIAPVNNQGVEGAKVRMIETATSGIYMPQTLVNYGWIASNLFTPVYKLNIYADDSVFCSLTATVVNKPVLVKFMRLVRYFNSPTEYEEIQKYILGSAPDFTLTRVGTTNINANGMSNRNSVEVKIDGVTTQPVTITNTNNLGVENAPIQMTIIPGTRIYRPVPLSVFYWPASNLFTPTYKLNLYVGGEKVGTLTVTVYP